MKRDMELVRKILFALEAHESIDAPDDLPIDNVSSQLVTYHVKIMAQAGLIEAIDLDVRGGSEWLPVGLTWAGHEFLDNARNDSRWKKLRKLIGDKAGGASFAVISSTLTWLTEEAIKGTIKIS